MSNPFRNLQEHYSNEYDLVFATCRIVAKHKKIALIRPQLSAESGNLFEYIENVAEASDIRLRKVALPDHWWNKDSGALLGFYHNHPCALLPKKMGGYQLIDLKEGQRIPVTAQVSERLSAYAFYFYPSLPVNIRKLKDLLSFSFVHAKNDFLVFLSVQVLISLFTLVVPVSLGYIFNIVIPNIDFLSLWQLILLLVINTWVITLFSITQTAALMRLRFKLEAVTTPAIWDRVLKFPLRFFRRFSAGDLAFRARIITDVQNTVTQSSLLLMANGFTMILILLLLFYYSSGLAVLAGVMTLIIVIVTVVINYRQLPFMRRLYSRFGQSIGFVFELISGISKIRVTDATLRVFTLWVDRLAKRSQIELKMKSYRLRLDVFTALLTVVNPLTLYALAQWLGNPLSFGDFVAFNAAYSLFFITAFKMTADLEGVLRVLPLWRRAREILTAKIEREAGHSDPGELNGDIVMENIVFRYHAYDQPLFKGLSLSIKPGEFIAVVGPSGSGKSTLFRLMLGFEEAEAGEIYYNGMNLRNVKLAAVRRQIGVVIQNSTLIPGTIFANIAGNSAKMTRIQAWEIAEKVGLAELIKYLPMQMDTLISEGAVTLSGGEVQRLILARALAQQPRILVLDEATSALDNTTQAVVHNYLKQLHATQIIAAHRLSTIVNADRIIVMEKGSIVQMGTFSELMSQPGLFSQMAKRQV